VQQEELNFVDFMERFRTEQDSGIIFSNSGGLMVSVLAIFLFTRDKRGISASQIARTAGISIM
jgi:hypothetical protein